LIPVEVLAGTTMSRKVIDRLRAMMMPRPRNSAGSFDTVPQVSLVPDGHFYSPIPSHDDIRRHEERIFRIPESLPEIDLNQEEQLRTLAELSPFCKDVAFTPEKTTALRYFYLNPMFCYVDAICLYALIRHLKPKNIIEVGAGYSSCVMLDTNERFFDNGISCTFIEPNPVSFRSLLHKGDEQRIQILPTPLQEVDLKTFAALTAGDILFIDSTHVTKAGSDVNYLVFEVLPVLRSGVYVHFHDIFYPFEYPKQWICDLGISWNEAYLLRAFLQYNQSFRIALFIDYLERFHAEQFRTLVPRPEGAGGGLWLRAA
jgi:Methyltransferase domain